VFLNHRYSTLVGSRMNGTISADTKETNNVSHQLGIAAAIDVKRITPRILMLCVVLLIVCSLVSF
jgi:hypothetical protein